MAMYKTRERCNCAELREAGEVFEFSFSGQVPPYVEEVEPQEPLARAADKKR